MLENDCKVQDGFTGLLVRAGGSLAAPARAFFNDGVSNEGVSHVI